jgi:excisionase family DNA binding protein
MESKLSPLLDIPTAAKLLGISKSKLYTMAAQRQIPSVKMGKNIKIRESDLEKWIEAHCQDALLDDRYMQKVK